MKNNVDFWLLTGNVSWVSLGGAESSDPNPTSQPLIHSHSLWPKVKANWSLTCCLSLFPRLTLIGCLEAGYNRTVLNPRRARTKPWKSTGEKGPQGNSKEDFCSASDQDRLRANEGKDLSLLTMLSKLAHFPRIQSRRSKEKKVTHCTLRMTGCSIKSSHHHKCITSV